MNKPFHGLVLALFAASVYGEAIVDGYKRCTRADDGRPVCISVATSKYHFVTEEFFTRFISEIRERGRELSSSRGSVGSVDNVPRPEAVFETAARSIVTIVAVDGEGEFSGLGSGVVVRPTLVATNCHVLEEAHAAAVIFNSEPLSSELIDVMVDRDLCLLYVEGLRADAIEISSSRNVRVGQRVFALGAPHGLQLTFSEGMVSSLRGDGDAKIIQTTAPISPGSSGGALLSESGQLIGITTMQHSEGQNLNFAVPSDWLLSFNALR